MSSVFINDGFTLEAEIPGIDGLYPSVRFKYRAAQHTRGASVEWRGHGDPRATCGGHCVRSSNRRRGQE